MDLEPPSFESFYSPNHQPHSFSTIWADKDKPDDDADATISDADDHFKEDGENSRENGPSENPHEALEWENGIGTLTGSNLKFRMNEHGDIEVITESCDLVDVEESVHAAAEGDIDENNNSMFLENGDVSIDEHKPTDATEKTQRDLNYEDENIYEQKVKDANPQIIPPDTGDGINYDKVNFQPIGEENSIIQESFRENAEIVERKENETEENSAEDRPPSNKVVEIRNPDSSTPGDNPADFDPVLGENTLCKDQKYNAKQDNDTSTPILPAEILNKNISSRTETASGRNECIICGRPSRLANRFCSRQCLGKNAAIQRRANQLAVNKKTKMGKKRHFGKGRSYDHCSPQPNDVLTVVHDNSSGGKNDLKIKIRWSSAAVDDNDEDYSPEPREASKRRATASVMTHSGTRGGRRRRFSWTSYLEEQNASAAPADAFYGMTHKDPFPETNRFEIGMALEGVDPEHESLICPLSVAEVRGCRIRLNFCGYSESFDFWRDVDCPLIFPCGFCEETQRSLQLPKGYSQGSFVWEEYAKFNMLTPAPKDLFSTPAITSRFEVGQRLEAVDKHNDDVLCVATVQDVINNQVLIHFDGWSHNFDYWCPSSSPLLHPPGWSQQHDKELSPPKDYTERQKFQWENFLIETKTHVADEKCFTNKTSHDFESGMKLEVVDPRNKILVRVATVTEISNFKAKIHFDGWSDMYDFWVHLEDPDLHPAGWCERTGHPLEPPVSLDETSDAAWQTGGCPIPGCTGAGHIRGAKFQNHYSEFGCPYSPQNLTKDPTKDRLSVHRPRRSAQPQESEDVYFDDLDDPDFSETDLVQKNSKGPRRKRSSSVYQPFVSTPERKRTRSSLEGVEHAPGNGTTASDVSKWTMKDVAKFVEEITNDSNYGKIFAREEIDGRAVLMLSQADILTVLKIKLGPAVKIYNAILAVKEQSSLP